MAIIDKSKWEINLLAFPVQSSRAVITVHTRLQIQGSKLQLPNEDILDWFLQ